MSDFEVEYLADGLIFHLNRPAKLNAITKPILEGLTGCIDELEAQAVGEHQRVLIISGRGPKAFCAGTDLAETSASPKPERLNKSAMARDLFVRLSRSPLISVAAINGLAFGGGLELAMACKFRVAATYASFSLPEIKLGLLPAYGGTQLLPALVGKQRARDIMLTGRVLGVQEALAIGLIDRVSGAHSASAAGTNDEVPSALLSDALGLARSITCFSPLAMTAIEECLEAAGFEVTDEGLAIEDAAVRRLFVSDDAQEGVAAFLEKRVPKFKGS